MPGKLLVVLAVALLAMPAAAARAAPSPSRGRYVVRPGDSLTAIAQRYRVSMQALAAVNGLDWRKPLLIGVSLRVPAAGAAAHRQERTYLVRPGDTLSGIAARYRLPLDRLAAANRLDPTGLLLIGTRVRIPAAVSEADPYLSGSSGYDISYPNCDASLPADGFAIIGLNHGRPFTSNPCFTSQWAAARPPRSVYINTAYDRSLADHVSPECAAAAQRQQLRPAAANAYAVGCAEADAALQLLGPLSPAAIWLDVETDNSWASRRGLNRATINGILDRLLNQRPQSAVGVYSNTSFWQQIVGRWSGLRVPEWIAAGAADPPGCPAPFASGAVWLTQAAGQQLDLNTAC